MKSGSKIEGYWVYYPFHGAQFARRFENEEDAKAYFPISKGNKGRKLPLGSRVIRRIAWDTFTQNWSYDVIENLPQGEVDEAFLLQAAKDAL